MCNLNRRMDESAYDHHKRLVQGKLVDGTLAEYDYTELAPYVYGKDYSADVARRMMYGSCRTIELFENEAVEGIDDGDILNSLELKKIELQKEQRKFYDQRNALNKLIRERARQEELNAIIVDAIMNSDMPKLTPPPSPTPITMISDNDLLVSLNDIHYGLDVNNYWNRYNSTVCREMMSYYKDCVISIANTHKSENCVVWANGDLISGLIHHPIAVANKENVIQQITGVSEIIANFLAELTPYFKEIRFVSVAGNHSRIDTKERALKDERLDDLIEWYLEARLQNYENVFIGDCEKIDNTMYVVDIRGKSYCGVHGDFDGSDSKLQALQTMVQKPLYAVLSGHKHHNRIETVQGIKSIMAGSFLGMDDYCVSKRIYGQPEQLVCVCDKTGVRCSYDIALDVNTIHSRKE